MKKLVLFLLLVPAVLFAGPRFPNPKTPEQVWQNDLDLVDLTNQSPNRSKQRTSIPLLFPCTVGDIIWNVSAAPSGKIGWVCVNSSGTWKAFGGIDP